MLFLLRGEHEEVRMGPPAGRENHFRGFLQSLDRSNLCSLAQTWATLKDWHDSREAILASLASRLSPLPR